MEQLMHVLSILLKRRFSCLEYEMSREARLGCKTKAS